MIRYFRSQAIGFAALCAMAPGGPVYGGDTVAFDFEKGPLDETYWSLKRMVPRRHWIDFHYKRFGKGSLAIRVKGSDMIDRCKCQLIEIRETRKVRLRFGDDAWYAFSFRIDGRGGYLKSTRWQIGGWKQESDGSSFVAQRFDNGVFHITLESGTSRVLVATADGKPGSFFAGVKSGIMSSFGFLTETSKYDGKSDVKLEYGKNPILPDPRKGWVDMVYHIKGGLKGDGIIEVFANGRFIARARGTIGVKNMGGPTQYFRFGHNRAAMPGTATIFLDRFRRGSSRKDVELPHG